MQTDFALRTLLYLAHTGTQVSVEEVATAYGISRDHLFKVVQHLVRLGYVQSRAGRNGGIRLVRDPATVHVGEVVGHFEGRHGVLPCVNDPTFCRLEPGCVLRNVLIKAEQSFYDTLDRVSIADLIRANTPTRTGGVYNLTVRAGRTPALPALPPAALPDDGTTGTEPGIT